MTDSTDPTAAAAFYAPDVTALGRHRPPTPAREYAVVDAGLQVAGESLADAVDVAVGARVLDVAAGNGYSTLAAARRFARVTSTEVAPQALAGGRARAHAENLHVEFLVADVQDLPFADGSFDVVLSTFGAMFAPDQQRAAHEMLRVLRPGGRLGLANWTPDGFIGNLHAVIDTHIAPPPGQAAPTLWGVESHVFALFGAAAPRLRFRRRRLDLRYRSVAHWLEVFRRVHGPTRSAFASLAPAGQAALARDITALLEGMNRAGQDSLVLATDYLEVVAEKR